MSELGWVAPTTHLLNYGLRRHRPARRPRILDGPHNVAAADADSTPFVAECSDRNEFSSRDSRLGAAELTLCGVVRTASVMPFRHFGRQALHSARTS